MSYRTACCAVSAGKGLQMRAWRGLGLAVAVVIVARQASAEERAPSEPKQEAARRPHRLEIGLSRGYSTVNRGAHERASDFETLWAIPLLLDLDYRVSKHWSIGAYGELGFINNS